MSVHPLNLALRFLLELVALGAMGYWGWTQQDGAWRWIAALGIPLIAAVLWASFRVPGDQERMARSFQWMTPGVTEAVPGPGEQTRVAMAVPGVVRLLLEVVFFGGAVALLALADQPRAALIFGVVIVLHYVLSYDRIAWLLTGK